jgi:hypothetical protein
MLSMYDDEGYKYLVIGCKSYNCEEEILRIPCHVVLAYKSSILK